MPATLSASAIAARADEAPVTEASPAIVQAGEQRSARVESLRAVSALGVLTAHVLSLGLVYQGLTDTYPRRLLLGGGQGLKLFFAMSGFLLFLPFLRRQTGLGRPIDLRRYARNRMLRILPLYVTVVAVLIVIAPFGADRSQWWRHVLFIENFSGASLNRLDAPLWSVVVEVHFYVVLPFLAWAIAKLCGRSLGRTAALLIALGGASFALRATEVIYANRPNVVGWTTGKYSLSTLFYFFAGGMLLAVVHVAWERRPPAWASRPVLGPSTAWIAAGVVVYLVVCWNFAWQEPAMQLSVFLILAACVLPLRSGWVVRALEWRPLAALGPASYSVYLWHWPLLQAVTGVHLEEGANGVLGLAGEPMGFRQLATIGMPLCIGVGIVSYLLVERPFLRRRRGWGATAGSVPAPRAGAALAER